jgi:signal peptidase II
LIVAVALILAGAFVNIIDSVFWCNFDDSHSQLATLFSEQYGAYFHGKVVDMFYFHFGKEASLTGCYLGRQRFYF